MKSLEGWFYGGVVPWGHWRGMALLWGSLKEGRFRVLHLRGGSAVGWFHRGGVFPEGGMFSVLHLRGW